MSDTEMVMVRGDVLAALGQHDKSGADHIAALRYALHHMVDHEGCTCGQGMAHTDRCLVGAALDETDFGYDEFVMALAAERDAARATAMALEEELAQTLRIMEHGGDNPPAASDGPAPAALFSVDDACEGSSAALDVKDFG